MECLVSIMLSRTDSSEITILDVYFCSEYMLYINFPICIYDFLNFARKLLR